MLTDKLALIVPSRGRPRNAVELIRALRDTDSKDTDLFLVLDDDDPRLDEYLNHHDMNYVKKIFVLPREGKGMAKPLNHVASRLQNNYKYFGFMGDDHRPRTREWDKDFMVVLDDLGTGLVYGNDGHHGMGLPTAVAMTANIVKALDGMVPPNMIHLYLDNFWLRLGNDLNAIAYLGWIDIEHLHPVWGTAQSDKGYEEVNAPDVYEADEKAFNDYINSDAYRDLLDTIRGAV